MTVAVEQNLRRSVAEIEAQPPGFAFAFQELFEQHRRACHAPRAPLGLASEQ